MTLNVKEYLGRNIDKMPELLKDGRRPITPDQFLARRIDENLDWDNYADTGAVVARHPKGEMITVTNPSREILDIINPKANLSNGLLIISDEIYDSLEGKELDGKTVAKWADKSLTQKQVVKNPIWNSIAPNELERYAPVAFKRGKFNEGMGTYVPDPQEKPVMGLWLVWGLGGDSCAYGGHLGYYNGRLLGVAPKAQASQVEQALEAVVSRSERYIAPANVKGFRTDVESALRSVYKE